MKKLYFLPIFITLSFLGFSAKKIEARVLPPLAFPIPELGNCTSVQDCETYCDRIENHTACTEVGKTWGLIDNGKVLAAKTPTDEASAAEAARLGITFPIAELANCASVSACSEYCDQPQNYQACMDFGNKHGLKVKETTIPKPADDKLDRLAREKGITFPVPELGNCNSARECMLYCDDPAHETECRKFADKHGFEEGPPGIDFPIAELGNCRSEEECKAWCEEPDHHKTCFEWAKRHGFIDEDEEFGGPGGCTSEEECEQFCDENREECMRWCEEYPKACEGHAGGPREGPGGCQSEQECQSYCEENPEECNRWCEENPDKCEAPPEGGPGPGGPGGPGGCQSEEECNGPPPGDHKDTDHTGPGGCQSEEECRSYCKNHPEDPECGGPPPGDGDHHEDKDRLEDEGDEDFTGPGGCSSYDECENYCQENPDGCPGYSP